jgi:ribosomal protein S12 methylthiotransferase
MVHKNKTRQKNLNLETAESLRSAYPIKIYCISLGCAKNRVDSEIMLHQLKTRGFHLTSEPEQAEVILINTCSFIESATQESIDTILEAARLKEEGACRMLVVAGCFPQRYGEALVEQLPEVDLFFGTESFSGIADRVSSALAGETHPRMILSPDSSLWTHPYRRYLTTTPGTAYLKIAEGCSNRCAYCTIPSIRGPFRSRDPGLLFQEAQMLAERGVRELILVAQDITSYGSDLEWSTASLTDLTQDLLKIESFEWLRLLYLRPERITSDLLELMAKESRICPYLDIPLQHFSKRVLKAMHRPFSQAALWDLIEKIRGTLPQAALRTTFMVGFPGERDEDFQELIDFVSAVNFDHLGVFQYSPEEGTPAATYKEQVPEDVRQSRYDRLMEIQGEISLIKNQKRIGSIEPVLVTGLSPETDLLVQGRTRFQAPEVDGVVYITDGEPRIGEIVPVKITEAHVYDLAGVAENSDSQL